MDYAERKSVQSSTQIGKNDRIHRKVFLTSPRAHRLTYLVRCGADTTAHIATWGAVAQPCGQWGKRLRSKCEMVTFSQSSASSLPLSSQTPPGGATSTVFLALGLFWTEPSRSFAVDTGAAAAVEKTFGGDCSNWRLSEAESWSSASTTPFPPSGISVSDRSTVPSLTDDATVTSSPVQLLCSESPAITVFSGGITVFSAAVVDSALFLSSSLYQEWCSVFGKTLFSALNCFWNAVFSESQFVDVDPSSECFASVSTVTCCSGSLTRRASAALFSISLLLYITGETCQKKKFNEGGLFSRTCATPSVCNGSFTRIYHCEIAYLSAHAMPWQPGRLTELMNF